MDKKQVTIPKFIWVIAGILVVSIIFLIAVQMPFSQKIETYNKDHASAESQISQYEHYLKEADSITKAVEQTEAECSKLNDQLTVKPDKTVDDIRDLLSKHDMDLTTLSITDGVPDQQGGVSASGDPLYVSTLTYNFTSSEKKLIETLDFFEKESKGAYFISNIAISQQDEKTNAATTEESSTVSVTPASQLYNTTLTIKLYYFDTTASEKSNASSSGESSGESSEESSK